MTLNFPFEKHLNEAQLEAVMTIEGPVLVIAGAGSGKTRTIVYRLFNMLRLGISPENILLLTFTRKAAQSMLNRSRELIGSLCDNVFAGTFHAFSFAMLKKYYYLANLPHDFTILDQSDVYEIFNFIIKQNEDKIKKRYLCDKKLLANISSKLAQFNGNLELLLQNEYPHLYKDFEHIDFMIKNYEQYKANSRLLDFDDLLTRWVETLKNHEDLRTKVSEQFKYIMIDEYQDTNLIQAKMIKLIAKTHKNVMAVGDDSQSIYSFRGANYKNILEFPNEYPNCKIIKLEKNYRSTQPNLNCTNAIIAASKEGFKKRLVAVREGGFPPFYHYPYDDADQARFVVERIKELIANRVPPSEIAVLFRAGFHSFQLETELAKNNINYEKRGGIKIFESAHIKDILALLKLSLNPLDIVSLNRVLLFIKNIGPKTVLNIHQELQNSDNPVYYLTNYPSRTSYANDLRTFGKILHLSQEAKDTYSRLTTLHSWYYPYFTKLYKEDFPKRELDLIQLYEIAKRYENPNEFLADMTLDPPNNLSEEDEQNNAVILSTVHSAKGLEWTAVFIISLCEGKFPVNVTSPEEEEEERRLFYVAATRAKDLLFFLIPKYNGQQRLEPSRFFKEIPKSLIKPWAFETNSEVKEKKIEQKTTVTMRSFEDNEKTSITRNDLKIGDKIAHQTFGKGTVKEIIDDMRIKVLFEEYGLKTLHLEYAQVYKL